MKKIPVQLLSAANKTVLKTTIRAKEPPESIILMPDGKKPRVFKYAQVHANDFDHFTYRETKTAVVKG